jgi:WD40 repeat protein
MSISPDGKRGAYEDRAYQLFITDADGSNAKQIQTGLRFHLMPSWSPDGSWLLFVAGEHFDCHPHIVKADGTGLKKLPSRNGYRGAIDFLDVYDFHDGSSDLPVWAPDSKSVFYTAKVERNVELFRVTLDGMSEQLTKTPPGSMHYHPAASPDGKWLAYGSKRDGIRQLYVMRLSDKKEHRITDLKKGHAAMWPIWQPPSTFSLVVTNAWFDQEPNDSFATAQNIDNRLGVVGYATGQTPLDYFESGVFNYTFTGNMNGFTNAQADHDGTSGLQLNSGTDWMYRTGTRLRQRRHHFAQHRHRFKHHDHRRRHRISRHGFHVLHRYGREIIGRPAQR